MDKLLTVEEVSKILQIHWQTVLNYIKGGKIKAVKLERGYRVEQKDLQKFISSRKT